MHFQIFNIRHSNMCLFLCWMQPIKLSSWNICFCFFCDARSSSKMLLDAGIRTIIVSTFINRACNRSTNICRITDLSSLRLRRGSRLHRYGSRSVRRQRHRGTRGVDEWFSDSADDLVEYPFTLLSTSAYLVTKVDLHSTFNIYFKVMKFSFVIKSTSLSVFLLKIACMRKAVNSLNTKILAVNFDV